MEDDNTFDQWAVTDNETLLDWRQQIDEVLLTRVELAKEFLVKMEQLGITRKEEERPLGLDHELPTRREDQESDEGFD